MGLGLTWGSCNSSSQHAQLSALQSNPAPLCRGGVADQMANGQQWWPARGHLSLAAQHNPWVKESPYKSQELHRKPISAQAVGLILTQTAAGCCSSAGWCQGAFRKFILNTEKQTPYACCAFHVDNPWHALGSEATLHNQGTLCCSLKPVHTEAVV